MRPTVVVIGAGAGGILASLRAAECGARVILLEKTSRIGTKILISGNGKCNLAHAGDLEEILKSFRPAEARFLRPAAYRYRNHRFEDLVNAHGIETYTRPDGRVFPTEKTAKDVVAVLHHLLNRAGVELRLLSPVSGIEVKGGQIHGVHVGEADVAPHRRERAVARYGAKALLQEVTQPEYDLSSQPGTARGFIPANRVILATGGSSYPNSGTTGDGWPWLRSLGHTVVPIRAALAPVYLELEPAPPESLSGVALRDVTLLVRRGQQQGKVADTFRRDLLFTHQGVSGPCALGVSRVAAEVLLDDHAPVFLAVDLIPDQSAESWLQWAERQARQQRNGKLSNWLASQHPERFVEHAVNVMRLPHDQRWCSLPLKVLRRVAEQLKSFPLGEVRHVPIEKGEVVAGGVALDEVDPKTLASRKIQGLWLCGEILDIAGPVGGYNLTAAFATGYVAGESAAGGNPKTPSLL